MFSLLLDNQKGKLAMSFQQDLANVANQIRDPLTGASLAQNKMLSNGKIEGNWAIYQLEVTANHTKEQRERLVAAVDSKLKELGYNPKSELFEKGPKVETQKPAASKIKKPNPAIDAPERIPGVKHTIAVASGKGGVGKSTVTVQLAQAFLKRGYKVGIMDADIYGPSIPTMLGASTEPGVHGEKMLPPVASGIKFISIGLLVGQGVPLIWRGPMVNSVVKQFISDVHWGDLDLLLVDLPPGTGDAQLSLVQNMVVDGGIIVSTPQNLSLVDARRGLALFEKTNVKVLGVVENMAWFQMPDGSKTYPFGKGGASLMAKEANVPLLAEIPLEQTLRESGDEGNPSDVKDFVKEAFNQMAEKLESVLNK